MYTIRQLIDTNRKALADRKLGAMYHRHCEYVYEDGCRCAIGLLFDDDTLSVVLTGNTKYRGVKGLHETEVIQVENVPVFAATQYLHDVWARRVRFFLGSEASVSERFPKELYDFLFRLQNQQILESNYVQWLDLLDKHFPPTPAEPVEAA